MDVRGRMEVQNLYLGSSVAGAKPPSPNRSPSGPVRNKVTIIGYDEKRGKVEVVGTTRGRRGGSSGLGLETRKLGKDALCESHW